MIRSRAVALLAGASLAALLGASGESYARGGGHFGGGHFGGGHFRGGPEFHPEMRERFDRDFRRPDERRRPLEEHRDDAGRARDEVREHRDDAGRFAGDRRDLAGRDVRGPNGHWNRNAFWNNQFGGHNFYCVNCRWGWAGAVFWPFALGDIFSYAWWPYGGPPAFWDYGLNVILAGLFWPAGAYEWPDGYGAYAWSDDGSSYQYAREAHQNVYSGGPANEPPPAASDDTSGMAQTCSGFAPGVGVLPMGQIEQTLKPSASQRAAFNDLKAASSKAEAILNGACPSEPPLTPVGRIQALQKRLEAMDEAVDTVMGPFAAFSKVLTPEQQSALNAMGGSQLTKADPMQMSDIGGCADEGEQFTDVPVQEIEQSVKPDARQQTALNQLKSVASEAAQKLRLQCPKGVPATAEARLEAVDKRVHDTITAVNDVRPALVTFYDSLSDEQKARFDTLPPEQAVKK